MQALFREIGPVLPVHGKVTLGFDDCFYSKRKAARDLMQLHAGGSQRLADGLLHRIRHMDKAAPHSGILPVDEIEQRIHQGVAHKGASGVGEGCWNTGGSHFLHHGFYGQRGKVGGRTVLPDRLVHRLVACIVGDACVRKVDGNSFRRDGGPHACLPDTDDRIGTVLVYGSFQNGAGKSTLSNVLVGKPAYEVTSGSVTFNGKDLLAMKPEERAHEGLFLSFQQPVEIPGVSMGNFMRAAINANRKYHGMEPMSAGDFLKMMREKRKVVELDSKLANRSVNEGFSGGEKKRNEIFQMAMLEPKLSILDETDSGLDVDALRIEAAGINKLRKPDTSAIKLTH